VTVLRGFTDGKVGEFGAGIDYFIGLMSEELVDKTDILAVGIDPVSTRIFKMLYPQTTLHIGNLEKVHILNCSLDLVIGNTRNL
jgi:type III restriction protein res subunit